MKKMITRFLCAILACTLFTVSPVYAAEKSKTDNPAEPKVITYDNALVMALKDVSGIVSVDDNIKQLEKQRKDLREQLNSLPFGTPADTSSQLRNNISNIDKNIDSLKLNKEILRASTELSLRNALVNIANAEMDITVMESTVALNTENLRRVSLKRDFGLASDNDVRAAEQTVTQNKANLESLVLSLASEKQSLNKILQLPLTEDIVVTYEREEEVLPEELEVYITTSCKNDISIKQKQINVDIKKADKNNNKDSSQDLTFKLDYEKAIRERDDAKKALEAAIRSQYTSMEQLLKQIDTQRVDRDKSVDSYNTALARLKAGQVTQYDVDGATLQIENNEVAIEKSLNRYWLAAFMYAHPFLL